MEGKDLHEALEAEFKNHPDKENILKVAKRVSPKKMTDGEVAIVTVGVICIGLLSFGIGGLFALATAETAVAVGGGATASAGIGTLVGRAIGVLIGVGGVVVNSGSNPTVNLAVTVLDKVVTVSVKVHDEVLKHRKANQADKKYSDVQKQIEYWTSYITLSTDEADKKLASDLLKELFKLMK